MEKALYLNHLTILNRELMVALGCTEPIAIAYVAARARQVLAAEPSACAVRCSGNIIKNVKGVTVPNSGGRKGIDTAAVLGIVGGDPDRELAVLETVKPADIDRAARLLEQGFCHCELAEGVENLYIDVLLTSADGHSARVEARESHSNLTLVEKDGRVLFSKQATPAGAAKAPAGDKALLTVRNILAFADCAAMEDIRPVIRRQVDCNTAIAQEGLSGHYGVQAGRTLMEHGGEADLLVRARAAAAAGSDARMSGCPLPVVINSGSGNQGITVTLPVVEYARAYGSDEERLYRALVCANLISIHQKKYIGNLSAYCGAVSAACGAAAGVAYLMGEGYNVICDTITNTIATIGGMVCDGAKASCATKIATAVECALRSLEMARAGRAFQAGEGLVKEDVESTIQSVGRMGRVGMHGTDVEILNIMLGN